MSLFGFTKLFGSKPKAKPKVPYKSGFSTSYKPPARKPTYRPAPRPSYRPAPKPTYRKPSVTSSPAYRAAQNALLAIRKRQAAEAAKRRAAAIQAEKMRQARIKMTALINRNKGNIRGFLKYAAAKAPKAKPKAGLRVTTAKPQSKLSVQKPQAQSKLGFSKSSPILQNHLPSKGGKTAAVYQQQRSKASALNKYAMKFVPAPFKRSQSWASAQVQRMTAEQDRLRRNDPVARYGMDDIRKILSGDETGYEKFTSGHQRLARQKADEYYKANERKWATGIMTAQRNWERDLAQKNDWIMQAKNQKEFERRRQQVEAWATKTWSAIESDYKNYEKTQNELSKYAASEVTGKQWKLINKGMGALSKTWDSGWDVLDNVTQAVATRPINTALNFANPNRPRVYYDGTEIRKKTSGIKQAWDASKDQRIVATTKNRERELLGYNKGRIHDFAVKYADDAADLIAGLGFGSAAGKGILKGGSLLKNGFLRTKRGRDLYINSALRKDKFLNSKGGKPFAWLGSKHVSRSDKANDKIGGLNTELKQVRADFRKNRDAIYSKTSDVLNEVGSKRKGLFELARQAGQRSQRFGAVAGSKAAQYDLDAYIKRLDDFSDIELRKADQWARTRRWDINDKVRLTPQRQKQLEKLVEDYQPIARQYDMGGTASRYWPNAWGAGYDYTKSRAPVFNNGEQLYHGQNRNQLVASLLQRDIDDAKGGIGKSLKAIEDELASIKAHASKAQRAYSANENRRILALQNQAKDLRRLRNRTDRSTGFLRDDMQQTKKDAQGFMRNRSLRGARNSAADAANLPMNIWRQSVLRFNPAWYENNVLWNIPAAISAGGARAIPEMLKYAGSKKYRRALQEAVPDGVLANGRNQYQKAGGLGEKLENAARIPAYIAQTKAGKTPDEALKHTNRWLFDYGNLKNWERPLRTAFPFWTWSKGLMKLSATMPFHSPKAAQGFTRAYEQFYDKPYKALPSGQQSYTDPETGEEKTFDPKEMYKGKLKVGDKWYNTPFNAMNPENILDFGLNPFLSTAMEIASSRDKWDRPTTDRSAWQLLAEKFPQYKLGKSIQELATDKPQGIRRWFSEGGMSKWKQGDDASKGNYDKRLDRDHYAKRQIGAFFGIPGSVDFDEKEFNRKFKLAKFNKEFFAVDWDKKKEAAETNEEYQAVIKAQEKMARKYGFDLYKDIYDGYWSKYDTGTTRNTKAMKKDAFQFGRDFWEGYHKLPKGSRTRASQRRPYVIDKFDSWKRERTFADNPYYKIPEFNEYDDNGKKTGKKKQIDVFDLKKQEATSQRKRAYVAKAKRDGLFYDGKAFRSKATLAAYKRYQAYRDGTYGDKYKGTKTAVQYKGKWFKSAKTLASYKRYEAYQARGGTSTAVQYKGKWFKSAESMERYKTGELWEQYYALPKSQRRAFVEKHPELSLYDTPSTPEEWEQLRAKIRQKYRDKTKTIKGFEGRRAAFKKRIDATLPNQRWNMPLVRFK